MESMTVAYATANDYEYMFVSLYSLILSADKDVFFNIYFLVDREFSDESGEKLMRCCEPFVSRCRITFCRIGDTFDTIPLKTDFINRQTFFRLLLPELVTEDKCLYLDSDTIVCSDLQKVYNIEMGEDLVAGVKAPGYHLNLNNEKYCRQAKLPSIDQYINAGVLLMNLKAMREDNTTERFMELLDDGMESQDQDIINSVCYNRIIHLPFKYNVMVALTAFSVTDYAFLFPEEDLHDSWNNPQIIHYATRKKPWKSLDCVMGDYWWNVCKKSSMWDFFYNRMSEEFFSKAIYHTGGRNGNITTKNIPIEFDLFSKKNIIVYGAGQRAGEFIDYLKMHNVNPECILVSDSKNNPTILKGIPVKKLEDMEEKSVGKTLVIATSEQYHAEIVTRLQPFRFMEIIPLHDGWRFAAK